MQWFFGGMTNTEKFKQRKVHTLKNMKRGLFTKTIDLNIESQQIPFWFCSFVNTFEIWHRHHNTLRSYLIALFKMR